MVKVFKKNFSYKFGNALFENNKNAADPHKEATKPRPASKDQKRITPVLYQLYCE